MNEQRGSDFISGKGPLWLPRPQGALRDRSLCRRVGQVTKSTLRNTLAKTLELERTACRQ